MRLVNTSMLLVLLFVPVIGCGDGGANKTLETNEMQAYIDAHPEMAEELKARQESLGKPNGSE